MRHVMVIAVVLVLACGWAVGADAFTWGDLATTSGTTPVVACNGSPGGQDAALVLKYYAGLVEELASCPDGAIYTNPAFPPNADVNGDGKLGGQDAASILKYYAGLITCLPADTNCDGFGPEGGEGEGEGEIVAGTLRTFAGIDFVYCPAGTFMMGRYPGEQDSNSDEDPQHEVTLTQGFWMSKYEVTQAQWRAVTGASPSYFSGDNRPVEQVSWNDIAASGGFIEKLNASNPGLGFRLPTEAEWEYACRAGTTGDYAGSLDEMGWYDENSGKQTHPVGQKKPNAWGLYDMHGNVCEWCWDWYGENLPGGIDPVGPASGSYRVYRGGGWGNYAFFCRAAYRNDYDPTYRYNGDLGFRSVLPPGQP